jgi:hypothetical protein
VFRNVPLGNWYVYAFAYDDHLSGKDYRGMGTVSAGPIPLPVSLTPTNRNADVKLHVAAVQHGAGMITGHVTNVGTGLKPEDEAVFLTKQVISNGTDPKLSALAATLVQDNGIYMFDQVPAGRYYLYVGHYPQGFDAAPDVVGYYNTGTSPIAVHVSGSTVIQNVDIVVQKNKNSR